MPALVAFELQFSEHDVRDQGSLALFLARGESRCGIYWIDFEDGTSYVGQSVSARSRLTTHRRRWDDAVLVRFAECERGRLDEFEVAVIQHVQKLRPLRNKLLTARPAGLQDLVVGLREGASLALPWDRLRRGRLVLETAGVDHPDPTPGQRAAFIKLSAHTAYEPLATVLRTLVAEVLPSPMQTQSLLWTLSALPSTNKAPGWRRLATLSAGRLEILRVFESTTATGTTYPCYLNMHAEVKDGVLRKAVKDASPAGGRVDRHSYSSLTQVACVDVPNLSALARLLENDAILDEVYKLTVSMMRQGINPLRRFHNWDFAANILGRPIASASQSVAGTPRGS